MVHIFKGIRTSPSLKDIRLDFVVTPIVAPNTCAQGEYFVNSAIEHILKELSLDPQS